MERIRRGDLVEGVVVSFGGVSLGVEFGVSKPHTPVDMNGKFSNTA